ncbi:CGNR zinc finger domain-containing protein [Actinokineospora enzanensis]|uniref:CGNR zinc finger domain-containing protein n=1 Tax=Actinokineospora enzanensis TaxID=155975 RepID=UPI0005278A52|nr:CGNR zinc finger domain-containing protein [Actinokineospora enzanensis]
MSTAEVSAAHDVELVLEFLNTVDVEQGTDVLDDPVTWHAWLGRHQLDDEDGPLVRAVRDGLRSTVGATQASAPPTGSARVEVVNGLPTLVATAVTGAVLAAATRMAVRGDWARLKICPADECQWAFFDRSRNRSRTWCSMSVCGNREKARAWRERTKNN